MIKIKTEVLCMTDTFSSPKLPCTIILYPSCSSNIQAFEIICIPARGDWKFAIVKINVMGLWVLDNTTLLSNCETWEYNHGMLGVQSTSQSLCTRFVHFMNIVLGPTIMNAHCLVMLWISIVKSRNYVVFILKNMRNLWSFGNGELLVRKGH